MATKIKRKKEREKDERVEEQKVITKEKKTVIKEKEPKTVGMVSEDRSKSKMGRKVRNRSKTTSTSISLKVFFRKKGEKKSFKK